MIRNEKLVFNPLNGEEQDFIVGGCTPASEKEYDEKTFFEMYIIYQI